MTGGFAAGGVLCVLLALLLPGSYAASREVVVDLRELIRPLPPSVSDWTPIDVEVWMNTTIGYPEYSGVVREHLVDGPTLLRLDVAQSFLPRHPIHKAKLLAHIDILRNACACGSAVATDFWSYFGSHTEYVMRLGSGAAYLPRTTFLYVWVMDEQSYNALVEWDFFSAASGSDLAFNDDGTRAAVAVPWYMKLLYAVLSLAVPYVLLAFKTVALLWRSNYLLMIPGVGFLIVAQVKDFVTWYACYELMAGKKVPLKAIATAAIDFTMAIPPVVTLLSFILPSVVQYVFLVAFLLHCCLSTVSFVANFVVAMGNKEPSKDD